VPLAQQVRRALVALRQAPVRPRPPLEQVGPTGRVSMARLKASMAFSYSPCGGASRRSGSPCRPWRRSRSCRCRCASAAGSAGGSGGTAAPAWRNRPAFLQLAGGRLVALDGPEQRVQVGRRSRSQAVRSSLSISSNRSSRSSPLSHFQAGPRLLLPGQGAAEQGDAVAVLRQPAVGVVVAVQGQQQVMDLRNACSSQSGARWGFSCSWTDSTPRELVLISLLLCPE